MSGLEKTMSATVTDVTKLVGQSVNLTNVTSSLGLQVFSLETKSSDMMGYLGNVQVRFIEPFIPFKCSPFVISSIQLL